MGIRLMIADDQLAVRSGVIGLVEDTEIEVVGQAESCQEAIKLAQSCKPDVVLLDLRLPDASGLDAIEKIKKQRPGAAVLLFSAADELKAMAQAHNLGADGYVTKDLPRAELLKVIRKAASGLKTWTPRQVRQIASRAAAEAVAAADLDVLSPRERQILIKITEGCNNEAIAQALQINIETVKQHIKHLLRKLHVEDRTQAALCALREELPNLP